MAQIPGIYVEIKGDSTQLRKDMTAAKQIVTESARGMSNALNNALGPDQIKKGTNKLIESLGSLSRATANSSKVFGQLGVDLRDLQRVTGVTGQQFQQLQSKMLQTSAARAQEKALRDIAQAAGLSNREIQKMGQQFGLSRAQINSVTDSVNKAGQSFNVFGGLVRTALAYFSVDALIGFARGVVDVGIKVDSLERSFTAITGSAQGAAKEFEFLRETANRTGQNFYALTDSYRQLMAATQGTKIAGEETRKLFSALSEAAAVYGMSNQQLELSFKAFAQMAGKGVVQMEELKGQLGDSLPAAVNTAASAMGVSVKRLMEMSAAGELLAEDLIPKMADELHRFAGEAANTAALESGIAAVNRFNQAWTDLKANLYDNQVFTSAANSLSWVIEQYNSVLRVDGASKITEELERQGKELARNERLLAIYNSGFADPPKEKVAALTADIEKQKNAIDGLNLKLKQLKDATDPTVQAAIESGQKMADSWIKAEDLKVDAMLRAQKYENTALEEQAKAEERASQKALKAAEDAANQRVELAKSLSDTIAKNAMTETEVQLFELQKQIEAERKIAGESIALQKMVTDAHIREEERLTMLIKAGIDKRSAAEWESLEELQDGWMAFNEGKADADARAQKEIQDQQKETTNVMIDEWSNALESIQSSLADMIYEFDFSMDSILDIFKRMLAEMLAAIAMSGIKEAFKGLFGIGEGGGIFSGIVEGVKSAFGEGGGIGSVISGIGGALGLGKITEMLGLAGTSSAAGTGALTAGTSLALAEGTFGTGAGGGGFFSSLAGLFGGGGSQTATTGAAASGSSLSALAGGGMATLGAAVAGIGAVVGLISILGSDSLPPVIDQLNEMHVTAQQISSIGLSTEIGNVSAEMQAMVPALRNVALASWDTSTATLSVQSAFNSLHASMESGSETILQTDYRYDALTGTWTASLNVIDSYRQSLYDSMLAANQAADAVSGMGAATVQAAHQIAGAADSIGSILDSARQTMVTAGMDGLSYHAAGGIFTRPTLLNGGNVVGDGGQAEGVLPLPGGPRYLYNLQQQIDRIERRIGNTNVRVFIGDTELRGIVRVEADRLDADRDPLARGRRYLG